MTCAERSPRLHALFGLAALALVACGGGSSETPGDGCASGACDAPDDQGGDVAIDSEADATTDSDETSTDTPPDGAVDSAVDTTPEATPCDDGGCTGSLACCGVCVDLATDPAHCGGCGTSCTTAFCAASACHAVTLANVLANTRAALVTDGQSDDEAAAPKLATLLGSAGLTTRIFNQDVAGAVLDVSGEPRPAAGETFVAVGGPYLHHASQWLEATTTPVAFFANDTDWGFQRRVEKTVVASKPKSFIDDHHDVFIAQIAFDAKTTRVSFQLYGMGGKGTLAAVYWFGRTFLPSRASYGSAWTIVQWVDTNSDGVANDGDTFTTLATGS